MIQQTIALALVAFWLGMGIGVWLSHARAGVADIVMFVFLVFLAMATGTFFSALVLQGLGVPL